MYGLTRQELRFALLISSSHFTQHVFHRILPPLIPILAVALMYPLWQLGLLITLYSLGSGIMQAPLGILSDRVDRRYLLPTGLTIAGAGYIAFAFAPVIGRPLPSLTVFEYTFEGGFLVMSLAMLVVGVGIAVVHPVGYPMISDNVSSDNKGKVLGFFGASSKLGDAMTPALIAGLILVFPWHEIVLLLGTLGLAYGIALYLVLRNDEFETVPSGQRSETSDETTTSVLNADNRTYLYPLGVIYSFFIFSNLTTRGITTFFPAFVVAVYAYSVEVMGIAIGPESVANVYFALLLIAGALMQLYLGGLTDVHDSRLVLLGCMMLATLGLVVLSVVDLNAVLLLIVIIVLGTGLFGINPPRDALISDISPSEHEGRTFGYIWTASSLTAAAFPTIIGYILEVVGMREGFLILALGTIFAGMSILLLYSDRIYLAAKDLDARVEISD